MYLTAGIFGIIILYNLNLLTRAIGLIFNDSNATLDENKLTFSIILFFLLRRNFLIEIEGEK